MKLRRYVGSKVELVPVVLALNCPTLRVTQVQEQVHRNVPTYIDKWARAANKNRIRKKVYITFFCKWK